MRKFKSYFTAAAVMACLSAATAEAHSVTYVSGKGSDTNNCFSPATPCRTFQRAVNQTVAGGEVKALDPADYSPVTITKSITITGVQGAGIDTTGGTAITLNPSSAITVGLDHLIIQNVNGSGSAGVTSGPTGITQLRMTHCKVKGYETGIEPSRGGYFLIADTVITNSTTGIVLTEAPGTLDHVLLDSNTTGVSGQRGFTLSVVDTIASNNGTGFSFAGGPTVAFVHSTIIANGTGVEIAGALATFANSTIELNGTGINILTGAAISFGDNHIKRNGTDVKGGTLTNVGTQ